MRIPRSTEYAMNARPIFAEYAMNARPISALAPISPYMRELPAPMLPMAQSPIPTQLSPYMQELMKNYGYNPSFTRPTIPQTPDNFTQPIIQPMPTETPLSPYMQQLLQNYQVQNMLGQYPTRPPTDYLRTYGSGGMMAQ